MCICGRIIISIRVKNSNIICRDNRVIAENFFTSSISFSHLFKDTVFFFTPPDVRARYTLCVPPTRYEEIPSLNAPAVVYYISLFERLIDARAHSITWKLTVTLFMKERTIEIFHQTNYKLFVQIHPFARGCGI